MKLTHFLAFALCGFTAAGASAYDLTDYLPIYKLEYAKLIPQGTRVMTDINVEFDDYQDEYNFGEYGNLESVFLTSYMGSWSFAERFKWTTEGRLVSSRTEEIGSDMFRIYHETTYITDAQGRITGYDKKGYYSPMPNFEEEKVNNIKCTYTYDSDGNCIKVTIDDEGMKWDYFDGGKVTYEPTTTVITYTYNPKGLLVKAVETVNGKERSRQTFEYTPAINIMGENVDYLRRSVYTLPPNYDGPGTGTITIDYTHFGYDVPSGYVKRCTYKNMDEPGGLQTSTQVRTFMGQPLSVLPF